MSLKRELLIGSALFAGVGIIGGIAVAQNSAALRGYSPNEGSVPGVGIPQHNPPFPQVSPLPNIAPLASSATGSVFPPTSDGLVGSITPTADADVAGMWTGLAKWPVVAIHANLLPNGHVLTYGTPSTSTDQNSQSFDDWDPAQGLAEPSHTVTSNQTSINSFCSASKLVANELLLVTGGNSEKSTGVWDEGNRRFSAVTTAPLQYPRWYASIVRLPDNRVLAVGGSVQYQGNAYLYGDNASMSLTPEIFTTSAGWSKLDGATSAEAFGALDNRFWYPRAYVAPNGSVFGISNSYLWSMSTAGNGAITPVGYLPTTGGGTGGGAAATSVMYDIGKILLAGGGQRSNEEQVPASRQAKVIDINRVGSNGVIAPASNDTSPMTYGRHWGTAVALPTGTVLVLGGTAYANSGANAVYAGEIWDPATGRWTTTASAAAARLYHSTATLLLNGAVLNAGGGAGDTDSNSYFNAQVYFPPYLFTRSNGRVDWAKRPTVVTTAPTLPAYGATVELTMADKSRIASVSLISLAAVTHSQSMDQRRIPLAFQQANTKLKITYPTSRAVLPPGYYQLHIVDSAGVPSTGAVIEIKV